MKIKLCDSVTCPYINELRAILRKYDLSYSNMSPPCAKETLEYKLLNPRHNHPCVEINGITLYDATDMDLENFLIMNNLVAKGKKPEKKDPSTTKVF